MPPTRGSAYQETPELQERILSFKQTANFGFSDDVLLSILLCLLSGDRHMIVTAPPPLMPELRTMVEQLCVHAFGLQTVVAPSDHTTSPAEFVSGLFYLNNFSGEDSASLRSAGTPRERAEHMSASSETPLPFDNTAAYTHQRHQRHQSPLQSTNHSQMRPSKSQSFSKSINSPKLEPERVDEKELFIAYRRRRGKKNLNQDNDQISEGRRAVYGNTFNEDDNEEEEILASVIRNGESPVTRRRNTQAGPSKPSPTASHRNFNNLSLNLPLTPSSSQSRRAQNRSTPLFPSTPQFPLSPVNFNISPQIRTQSFSSMDPSVTTVGKKLPNAVILEGIADSSEAIQGALLEILVRRQLTDRGIVINCPRPFIVIALVPSFAHLHKVPLFLIDRFYICYDFKSRNAYVPPPPPAGIGDLQKLIQPDEMNELRHLIKEVKIHHDIMRYIRDIVVALRTHRHVQRGVTAKATVDLQLAVRTLAVIYNRNHVNPELVVIATMNVFSHRLVVNTTVEEDRTDGNVDDVNGSSPGTRKARQISPGDIISEVLLSLVMPPV